MNVARRFRGIVAVGLFVLTTVSAAAAKYSGGTGEPNDPYQIATAADLIALGETPEDYDKHFILTADIDLDPNLPGRKVFDRAVIAPDVNDASWEFDGTPYTGVFDGNGHTVSHLTIIGEGHLGLFGQLSSWDVPVGEVRNLGMVDVDINGSGFNVGALVGSNSWGTVSRCCSSGSVSGNYDVGGLVGENYWGTVAQCYCTAAASGIADVGGLVGENDGSLSQCYSTGVVTGTSSAGGLVGYAYSQSATGCFWDTQTSGRPWSAGGTGRTTAEMQDIQTYQDVGWDFAGEIKDGLHEIWQMPEGGGYPILSLLNGHRPPQLKGQGTAEDPYLISSALELGGIIHYSLSAHYRLTASIDLSGIHWGTTLIPRFTGSFDGNAHVISHVTITGKDYVGLFGQLASGAQVKDLGLIDVNITGSGSVGSLAGCNNGSVTRCYSTGTVSVTSGYIGGLVGYNNDGGVLTQCCSSGTVTGIGEWAWGVGGLVGSNLDGHVNACYSDCAVSGNHVAGGLVGDNEYGYVTRSYSAGAVTGKGRVGGLVGDDEECIGEWMGGVCYSTGDVTQCFWDTQTSGQATSAGGTGRTTAEMQTAKTFLDAGWDFVGETANGTEDIWWILEGKDYPRLWWETTEE